MLSQGCGGGSGSHESNQNSPITQIPITRPFYFTYYGSDDDQSARTATYSNLFWIARWDNDNFHAINQLTTARSYGFSNFVIDICSIVYDVYVGPGVLRQKQSAREDLRLFLHEIQATGNLATVRVLYPCDEPNNLHVSDSEVNNTNTLIKQVASEFPELVGVKLGVIYGHDSPYPGYQTYDLVGWDDYGVGDGVINEFYQNLDNSKKYWLVSGSANPWRTNLANYYNYSSTHQEIYGVVAFIYVDWNGGLGVKHNGTEPEVCKWARLMINREGNC